MIACNFLTLWCTQTIPNRVLFEYFQSICIQNQTQFGKTNEKLPVVSIKYAVFFKVVPWRSYNVYMNTLRYVHFFYYIPYLVLLTKYQPFVGGVRSFENKI